MDRRHLPCLGERLVHWGCVGRVYALHTLLLLGDPHAAQADLRKACGALADLRGACAVGDSEVEQAGAGEARAAGRDATGISRPGRSRVARIISMKWPLSWRSLDRRICLGDINGGLKQVPDDDLRQVGAAASRS